MAGQRPHLGYESGQAGSGGRGTDSGAGVDSRAERFPTRRGRWRVIGMAALVTAVVGFGTWWGGCTNDPFDPASVPNQPPRARIFIAPGESDSLNATSYYRRTFYWSGSDVDGFVVRYFVSIATVSGESAPWDTTVATDTTMTFSTDDEGHAEATICLVCEDNRGALSDTVCQYIPLRNFPPVINFQSDFDTLRWSYSAANFRFFALDLDGNETMADSFLYRLDTADTNVIYDYGEPGADPALGWVRKSYADMSARTFAVDLHDIPPAPQRTLTVSVIDEAYADTRFHWTWEVRPAVSPLLVVSDSAPFSDQFYHAVMDSTFGVGQWSRYEIVTVGMPDQNWVLVETFRQFEAVMWYTGGTASLNLRNATAALREYLQPTAPGAIPGKLLLISSKMVGTGTNLSYAFIQQVLGLNPTALPPGYLNVPSGKQALGLQPHLPSFASASPILAGAGIQALAGTEYLYQLEYCRNCYTNREPYDPYVGFRRPERSTQLEAAVVGLTLQLEYCNRNQAGLALRVLLADELGVDLP